MIKFFAYKNKNIGIFGLGKTGNAAYNALKSVATLICYDDNIASRDNFVITGNQALLVDLSDPKWQKLDSILLSPGLPSSHQIMQLATANNIPIISDIELLFEECPNSKFVAITGTNGKSTTTALIHHITKSAGIDYPCGGNIGVAALSLPVKKDGYVLELSSFQIDLLQNFKAHIAVLLNITPDHLDRYENMPNYIHSKERIFNKMTEGDFAIIGVDNDITKTIKPLGPKIIPISSMEIQEQGVAALDGKLYDNIAEPLIFDLSENQYLLGSHNRENIAASYATCRVLGIPPKLIIQAIATFQGLAHRMQYIGKKEGFIQNPRLNIRLNHLKMGFCISFYNDSKATNADAASKSLAALDNIYWLAGGIAKEGGISSLEPYFNKIRTAYLFGQDKLLFASSLEGKVPFKLCEDLEEAFASAVKDAQAKAENAVVLLAPAAASYDQFKNFEHRGDSFIKLCNSYLKEIN